MATNLPYSQACENNKTPILEKLRVTLMPKVLEVGTGTGQHAVHFATAMPTCSGNRPIIRTLWTVVAPALSKPRCPTSCR